MIAILITSMATRTPIILDIIRDRNTLFRELPGDIVENTYTLKLINQNVSKLIFVFFQNIGTAPKKL